MTISDTVKKKLKESEFDSYPSLESCSKPMDAGLWALAVLKKEIGLDEEYFTADDITKVLKIIGYPFKPDEIIRGFTKAAKKIDKIIVDGIAAFMIMEPGIKYLKQIKGTGEIETIFLDGTKHWTDYKQFSQLIQKTHGDIKILDKFYSRKSLQTIADFGKKRKIQFLTSKLSGGENQNKFCVENTRFKQEFKNVEIRIYSKEYELHDRYIITSDFFILLGRGLQEIGSKESFVIAFSNKVIKDTKSLLESKFDERWKKSNNLK